MYYRAILLVMNKKVEIMKWWTCDHFVSSHQLKSTHMMQSLSFVGLVYLIWMTFDIKVDG